MSLRFCHFFQCNEKFIVGLVCLSLFISEAVCATELINDGWSEGQSAGIQTGFGSGDIGASRFVQVSNCPCSVTQVRFFLGGDIAAKTVRLHIWEDGAGTSVPGLEIFAGNYELTGSNTKLQVVDLANSAVSVNGPFRVGIEFLDDGLPSIARDTDGNIQPNTNYILGSGFDWTESSALGVPGDWIIRASIESDGEVFRDGFE